MAALIHAYDVALTTLSNESEFAWFWLGVCLLEFPLVGLVVRKATPPSLRTGLLTLFGFVSFAPKLLRDPTSPVFHDEFAHWRELTKFSARESYFGTTRCYISLLNTRDFTPPPLRSFMPRD